MKWVRGRPVETRRCPATVKLVPSHRYPILLAMVMAELQQSQNTGTLQMEYLFSSEREGAESVFVYWTLARFFLVIIH